MKHYKYIHTNGFNGSFIKKEIHQDVLSSVYEWESSDTNTVTGNRTEDLANRQIDNYTGPMATMFTTFCDDPAKEQIYLNTIKNWAFFKPDIQPILYINQNQEKLINSAKQQGWLVYPIPGKNGYGTPYLKAMFFHAMNVSNSFIHGYCNGDILFEEGLLQTMKMIHKVRKSYVTSLVIGVRRNVNISNTDMSTLYLFDNVRNTYVKHRPRSAMADAEDYFFFARASLFSWKTIKDVVVGRPGYDNYLVAEAHKHKAVSVVDASRTVLAFHQTGRDGDMAGLKRPGSRFNYRLIGLDYPYIKGMITGTRYVTVRDVMGLVHIMKRQLLMEYQREMTRLKKEESDQYSILDVQGNKILG